MLLSDSVPRIHLLDQTLANQIAAGEVVERPASVVKELLENALDSGADRIAIELERGGNTLIRISDNGSGIHPEDLELILQRHSTSKIRELSDLESLNSLGFRGEALASISSVSEFSIVSAIENQTANKLHQENSGEISITPCARNRGTTVEVRNLFFNTPARRKFLRSEQTEYLHSLSTIKRQMMGRFGVYCQLIHNGKKTLTLNSSADDYSERIARINGKAFLRQSFCIDYEHVGMRLWGWLGLPEYSRNQTDMQYFYLNGRYLRDKQINHAIRLAYGSVIPTGRYPCFVLFFEIDGKEVDVNVHPSKQEVRFSKIRQVHDFIFGCIERSLNKKPDQILKEHKTLDRTYVDSEQDYSNTVREDVEEYQRDNLKDLTIIDLIDNRFLIFRSVDRLGIFDSFHARIDEALTWFQQQQSEAPMPLLMPRIISGSEKNIESFLDYLDLLGSWSIVMHRVSPTRLHVSHLPRVFQFTDFQAVFNDVEQRGEPLSDSEVFDSLRQHINDQVDTQNSTEDVSLLFKKYQRLLRDRSFVHQSIDTCRYFYFLGPNEIQELFRQTLR